jgi:hypothetical protein
MLAGFLKLSEASSPEIQGLGIIPPISLGFW